MKKILPYLIGLVLLIAAVVYLQRSEPPAPVTTPSALEKPADTNVAAAPSAIPAPTPTASTLSDKPALNGESKAPPEYLAAIPPHGDAPTAAGETNGPLFNLPNGISIRAREGGLVDKLGTFLSTSKSGDTRTFALDEIGFEAGALSATSAKQLDDLVAILRAFPDVSMVLEPRGSGAGAQADSIRTALLVKGVAPERLDGKTGDKPPANPSNPPPKGDWVAVVVTKK